MLTGVELVALISSATTGLAGVIIAISMKRIQCCLGGCHCEPTEEKLVFDKPKSPDQATAAAAISVVSEV